MATVKRHKIEIALALLVLMAVLTVGIFTSQRAQAADNQGAYTMLNARAAGYEADSQIASFVTLSGTDTLTGLEDPVTKFTAARIFRLRNVNSASTGVKQNLKLQLKFSGAAASATIWVAFYYVDPAAPTVYYLTALKQPLGGTITATAAVDSSLYLAPVSVMDSYGATHCVVFCDTITAGTVNAWLGSY